MKKTICPLCKEHTANMGVSLNKKNRDKLGITGPCMVNVCFDCAMLDDAGKESPRKK